ncbi:hypothetical protein ACRRTK_014764 [Alexandromys fortis]
MALFLDAIWTSAEQTRNLHSPLNGHDARNLPAGYSQVWAAISGYGSEVKVCSLNGLFQQIWKLVWRRKLPDGVHQIRQPGFLHVSIRQVNDYLYRPPEPVPHPARDQESELKWIGQSVAVPFGSLLVDTHGKSKDAFADYDSFAHLQKGKVDFDQDFDQGEEEILSGVAGCVEPAPSRNTQAARLTEIRANSSSFHVFDRLST